MSGPHRLAVISSRRAPIASADIVDGGSLNIFRIISSLKSKGCSVDMFTRSPSGLERVHETHFGRVVYVPYARSNFRAVLSRDFAEGASFVEQMARGGRFVPSSYGAVHSHHWTSTIGLVEHLGQGQRYLHTPHLLAHEKALHNGLTLPTEVRAAESAALHRADAVFALSGAEARACISAYGLSPDKILQAPNGIDQGFFDVSPRFRAINSPVSLLGIGRICRQKGVDILLEAFGRVVATGVPIDLRWIGSGYQEPGFLALLKSLRQRHDLGRVRFIPGASREGLMAHFREADIYVQPSRYESQGVALLEAMAAARPVIASELPATREFLTPGTNGVLVPAGDPAALSEAIRTLVDDPKYANALALAARESVSSFTWDRMLECVIPQILAPA